MMCEGPGADTADHPGRFSGGDSLSTSRARPHAVTTSHDRQDWQTCGRKRVSLLSQNDTWCGGSVAMLLSCHKKWGKRSGVLSGGASDGLTVDSTSRHMHVRPVLCLGAWRRVVTAAPNQLAQNQPWIVGVLADVSDARRTDGDSTEPSDCSRLW
ncbi:unnamed protein product [Rangifer tarandus platyrhynchus]|uniref:Uncharacterized protein n=1 Tax=Rangifer tarandus platyrhynchus TaxID=3082113 RepID=A0ABN8XIH8_RANTA|nr:unnamed protein product [Rangifer tarandus platyrhynchus]